MGSDHASSQRCTDCGAPSRGYRYCGRCGARIGDPVSLTGQAEPSTKKEPGGSEPPAKRRSRVLLLAIFLVAALVGGAFAVSELQDDATPEAAGGEVRLPDEAEEGDLDSPEEATGDEGPPIECVELPSCLRWQADVDASMRDGLHIDAAEDAVVVSSHGHIEVFGFDGTRRWTAVAADASVWGGPVVVAGDLVLALAPEALVAFDLQSGEPRWRAQLADRGLQFLSPLPAMVDDTLLVSLGRPRTGQDGPPPTTLYGLDPRDGEELWTRDANQAAVGPTSIALLADNELELVDPGRGEPLWRATPSWPGGLEPGTRVPVPSAIDDRSPEEGDEQDREIEAHPWLTATSAHVLLTGRLLPDGGSEVTVIDAATGDELAAREGHPVAVGDRLLLLRPAAGGRVLTVLDERAEVAWELELDDDREDCCTRVQSGPGGVALLGPGDRLRLLDPEDGTVRHDIQIDLDEDPLSHIDVPTTTSAVLHTGPSAMGGGGGGESRGVELATGRELWRVRDATPISLALPGVYLAVTGGTLYALDLPGDAPVADEATGGSPHPLPSGPREGAANEHRYVWCKGGVPVGTGCRTGSGP